MTKFVLFMWMCSSVAQQCIPGMLPQTVFDTYKDCVVFGCIMRLILSILVYVSLDSDTFLYLLMSVI